MQLIIQIAITDESGEIRTEELMTLQKSGDARNDIGLSVSESKQLLKSLQQVVVQQQADEYIRHNIVCPHCLSARRIKGRQAIQYDAVWCRPGIGTSGAPLPLRGKCDKNCQPAQ